MVDSEIVLASAIVLPEAAGAPEKSSIETTPTLKRRQTDTSENDQSSKRVRLSQSPTESTNNLSDSHQPARRDSTKVEERKRGQRMFGALLGVLSQKSGSNAAARRRADIEKRQRDKLKQVAENASAREREQTEDLKRIRRKEQWKWDDQTVRGPDQSQVFRSNSSKMRIRHSNMLLTAKFLTTSTKPKLYYKPWQLRPDEEAQVARQVEDAEAQIDREIEDFEERRREALEEEERLEQLARANENSRDGESAPQLDGAEQDKSIPVGSEPSKPATESSHPAENVETNVDLDDQQKADDGGESDERKEDARQDVISPTEEDHNDADMVVADEDTVIY